MKSEQQGAGIILEVMRAALIRRGAALGLTPEQLATIADHVELRVRIEAHGHHYIAKVNRSRRNREILREFNGRNHDEVCRRFDIHITTLYRLLQQRRPRGQGESDPCK